MARALGQQRIPGPVTRSLSGTRFDHLFFPGIAWLMLVAVFVGFAPSYYLAGVLRAPLPSLAIHVHAVVFSCWVLLLIAQTSLTAAGRVDIHGRLGIAGFILASSLLIVGVWAATDQLARVSRVRDPLGFYIFPLANITAFAVLIVFACCARFDSAAHKRLIVVASTALMSAPIARWHLNGFLPYEGIWLQRTGGRAPVLHVHSAAGCLRSIGDTAGPPRNSLGGRLPNHVSAVCSYLRKNISLACFCRVGSIYRSKLRATGKNGSSPGLGAHNGRITGKPEVTPDGGLSNRR